MKRELAAAAVLATLLGMSIWNLRKVETITSDIEIALCKSQSAAETLDFKSSREYMAEGLELWLSAEQYSHCFLSQPQINSVSEAFYALQQSLSAEDVTASIPSYSQLRSVVEGIRRSETPSLGSIF